MKKPSEVAGLLQEWGQSKKIADRNLAKSDFAKADFSAGSMARVDFTDARLKKTQFTESSLKEVCFTDAVLKGADFSRATLDQCRFEKADLGLAKFGQAKITGGNFSGLHAELSGFVEAVFKNVVMQGAVIKAAQFDKARLEDCDLSQTDLSDAFLTSVHLLRCNLADVTMLDAKFNQSQLEKVRFNKADLRYSDWVKVRFVECDFTDACCKLADFSNAVFERCTFANADFKGAAGLSEATRQEIVRQGGRVSRQPLRRLGRALAGELKAGCGWIGGLCRGVTSGFSGWMLKAFNLAPDQKPRATLLGLGYAAALALVISLTILSLTLSYGVLLWTHGARGSGPCLAGPCGGPAGQPGPGGPGNPGNPGNSGNGGGQASATVPLIDPANPLPSRATAVALSDFSEQTIFSLQDSATPGFAFDTRLSKGQPLRRNKLNALEDELYETAMAVLPNHTVRVLLDGQYSKFNAFATMPPDIQQQTRANFIIKLDNGKRIESGPQGYLQYKPMAVDVSGCYTMDLEVQCDDPGPAGTYFVWGNAYCTKQADVTPPEVVKVVRVQGFSYVTKDSPLLDAASRALGLKKKIIPILGKRFIEGFCVPVNQSLTLDIGAHRFTDFKVSIGFPTSPLPDAKGRGVVDYSVVGDGTRVLASGRVAFGDLIVLELKVAGVKTLTLGNQLVRGNATEFCWANPRFAPEDPSVAPGSAGSGEDADIVGPESAPPAGQGAPASKDTAAASPKPGAAKAPDNVL